MACRNLCCVAVLAVLTVALPDASPPSRAETLMRFDEPGDTLHPDPVIARVHEHLDPSARILVRAVDSDDFPPGLWKRVRHLVAFRIHRHMADSTTQADAAIYLVRTSELYTKAEAALRNHTSNHEYVWCLLAAVIAHEAAHTRPLTEVPALTAEAAQLRRCLFAGHLYTGDGWSAVSYLGKVEAKLRNPREHY
jgi:hypothetical protein